MSRLLWTHVAYNGGLKAQLDDLNTSAIRLLIEENFNVRKFYQYMGISADFGATESNVQGNLANINALMMNIDEEKVRTKLHNLMPIDVYSSLWTNDQCSQEVAAEVIAWSMPNMCCESCDHLEGVWPAWLLWSAEREFQIGCYKDYIQNRRVLANSGMIYSLGCPLCKPDLFVTLRSTPQYTKFILATQSFCRCAGCRSVR